MDTLVTAYFGNETEDLTIDNTGNQINLSDGTTISNIEYFTNLTTGSGNDTVDYTQAINRDISVGDGDDTINLGRE